MKKSYRLCLMAILALSATGCTTLLRKNVDSIRSGIGDIYVDQTLDNLVRLVDDPQAIPSLSDLGNGSVESDLTFSPSVTVPFGNTVATTVVGTAGETITAPSRTFTLGGSVGNKLSFAIAPVSDPIRLRNTLAVYRYVLSPAITGLSCDIAKQALRKAYQFPVQIGDDGAATVDKSLLLYPQCILCLMNPADFPHKTVDVLGLKDSDVTGINHDLAWGWLHSETDPADRKLRCNNSHCISMSHQHYDNGRLRDLTLLIMQMPPPPPSSKPNG
jgi:hypothetical protein